MDRIKNNKKVTILDLKNIESKMSFNSEMEKLIGRKAKIVSSMKNCYDGKYYYKIDLDFGVHTWASEWLNSI